MKKRILLLWLCTLVVSLPKLAAQVKNDKEASAEQPEFFMSSYNIKPQLLKKGHYWLNVSADIPRYFKYYNGMTHQIEDKLPVVVINDTYFNANILYGLNDQWNMYLNVPFTDSHHYSPMLFQKGIGFGDVKTGLVYGNLFKTDKHFLSLETRLTLPTGIYKHDPEIINTGNGAYALMLGINGLEKFSNSHWQMAYQGYFDYRLSKEDMITKGHAFGANLLFQRPFHTKNGYFGWENAIQFNRQFPDQMNGQDLPMTDLTEINLSTGGWYKFLDKFYLRFTLPYTIYQNDTYFTKHSFILQLDYLF
ncbi:MAG TPA: hypothetical protein ENK64_02030 [Flavobacteriales bacterium]|nr:hypothetical protein [Flavobacteriales bacterium]